MYIAEDQLRDDTRTVDTSELDSAIEKYISIRLKQNLHLEWAASFLLHVGSVVILAVVVLLMPLQVLFERSPHTVAAIITALLIIVIILTTILLLNDDPVDLVDLADPVYT
ncbi:uncharacterized protein LOC112457423 isoform X1 [Temnothorax curvispinosus]|uniref:Uncharacterized protein LOC112457423 isoform X1 n=1 Tax=Temnothorax curvispinosus TaxID=300111 RepID=A0A6J1Q3J0_9HYME|nr:uncharacterized protein LOC112457423 isoform X1 [Temnothorax curvispinosus]